MKWIKGLFGFIWKIYFFLVVAISILLLYPIYFVWLQNEKHFKKGFNLIRKHAKFILFCVGIRIKVIGSIPDDDNTSYIICPNHSSYLDILILYAVFPNYFIFLGKKELGKVPVFNIFFKKMNILVDRKNAKAAHQSIVKATEAMEKGSNLVIFPEGTIPHTAPKMKPFKNGAFRLARQLKMPIVPITFVNNWKLLEDSMQWTAKSCPGISKVYIHSPIIVNSDEPQDLLTLREQTRAVIQSKLDTTDEC